MSTPTTPGTGKVLDFQEAKARLLNPRQNSPAPSEALSSAVERFTFSRLPQVERIARTVATLSLQPDQWGVFMRLAEMMVPYVDSGFTVLPKCVTLEEVNDAVQTDQES